MKTKVLKEEGFKEALFALGLSFGKTSDIEFEDFNEESEVYKRMLQVAKNLSGKDGGHNSFLELINVWVEVDAPRYWHSERDRYRLSTQYSESTMHTLKKRELTQEDFERPIDERMLEVINEKIREKADIETLKEHLPEGFLQRRVIVMNYKCLRNILLQREGHRLPQWKQFADAILSNLKYKDYLSV